MPADEYSLEEAADHIAQVRGELTAKEEQQEITTLIVDGQLTATGGTAAAPIVITTDTWHSLGSLAGFTVNVGRYRLTPHNEVQIDIELDGTGTHGNNVTFANTMGTVYRPLVARHQPLARTGNIGANLTDQASRAFVDTTGAVSVLTPTNDTASFGNTARIPLD